MTTSYANQQLGHIAQHLHTEISFTEEALEEAGYTDIEYIARNEGRPSGLRYMQHLIEMVATGEWR